MIFELLLLNREAAAGVEVSENSPPEADFLEERAVNDGKTVMGGVNQHIALHAGQDFFYVRGRLVVGIGPEPQFHQSLASPANAFRSLFFSGALKRKGIRKGALDAERPIAPRV